MSLPELVRLLAPRWTSSEHGLFSLVHESWVSNILTWLKPLVAPRDARLGDALETKMKIAPVVGTIALDACLKCRNTNHKQIL